jgi:tellurite resistance protein
MNKQQTALIYTMVLVSAADRNMTDAEMRSIGDLVLHLPVFSDLQPAQLIGAAEDCAGRLSADDGLDNVLELIRDSLPSRLRETAYVLACDVAAADERASQEELRMLEMIRYRLDLDRLVAAAIERAARARHAH